MRKFNKYKVYKKNNFNFFLKRIFNFKKTKWKKIQQKLLILKLKKNIIDHKYLIRQTKFWDRLKLDFRNQILQKNKLKTILDMKYFKKTQNFFLSILFYEYRLDFFLSRLKLFKSIYHSKIFILAGNVLINNNICFNHKIILKKGDVITFKKDSFINCFENISSKITKEINFSYFEFDFYTQTVVIIKSYFEINFLDLSLIFHEKLKV